MADLNSIAKPYARAVFELAQQQNDLAGWGHTLDLFATIAADKNLSSIIGHPRITAEQLQDIILDTAAKAINTTVAKLDKHAVNLIKLLVCNGRIGALPAIASAYAIRRAEAENVIAAKMITASELEPRHQQQFTAALQAKLGRTVQLEFEIDKSLLGGAVLRAGDLVIDGSVRAQLEQLGVTLSA